MVHLTTCSRLYYSNFENMYKGLQQQPTFVYTECSDATEVFFTQQENNCRDANQSSSSERHRFRFVMQEEYDIAPVTPPSLINSATSIIRKSAASPESRDNLCDVTSDIDSTTRPVVQLSVISKKNVPSKDSEGRSSEEARRSRLDTIPESLVLTQRTPRKSTDLEFLEFAKDFAKQFRQRPNESLLNPVQYDDYLQKVASRDRLHGNSYFYSKSNSRKSRVSLRSVSLVPSSEEKLAEEGHVVGDLVSFAANTMRYEVFQDKEKIFWHCFTQPLQIFCKAYFFIDCRKNVAYSVFSR